MLMYVYKCMFICVCLYVYNEYINTPYYTCMSSEYYTRKGWPFAEKEYLEGLFE